VKWLQEYGSLDEVVAHAAEIGGKVGENLRDSLEQLPLSRRLVTVKRDVALPLKPEQLTHSEPDLDKLRQLFTRLEFSTWLQELGSRTDKSRDAAQSDYVMITEEAELERWIEKLRQAPVFAFDTETTSLNAVGAGLVGLSFAAKEGEAAYVPVAHDYPGAPLQLSRDTVLAKLKPLLEDPEQHKVGQNLKYDRSVLAGHGVTLCGIRHDTMLQSYVLDSVATRHDLDSLALKYLGQQNITFEQVAGKGKAQLTFNQVPLEQATPYAAEDADVALRIHNKLWPRLQAEPRLQDVYERIEMPLVPVLSKMELCGVKIDRQRLKQQSKELSKRIAELEDQAHASAGLKFNIASPKQIQEVLYGHLELPVLRKTPKGQPSTAENVLQELAIEYELPRLILEHRALSKLKSTYTDKLPEMINPKTGRVHTSYHQAVAATGRLSSSDPNLQNIPIRTADGRRIRTAFIPEDGYVLMSADYSQIELRIMAHLSGDQGLLRAFAEGADIHRATAAEVFGVAPDKVSDDQRRHAKAINFGLIYGMSAFGLAQQLRIERGAAQEYVDLYFARYPGVKRYMEATREQARDKGYVETVFGRRLYVPDIKASNHNRRQYAERTAINAPMQGTAADLIKMAMLVVDDWLQSSGGTRMIMQVHDELVFEVPADDVKSARAYVAEAMVGVAQLAVPLDVEVGTGMNWAEAHA
jgi:DNA polymerase-1